MKLNVWLGMGALLFLSGCATVAFTPYDLNAPSRVAKNPSEVLIISDATKINKPYSEIGLVEAQQESGSSSGLIEELRKEAAKRGADAVINIQETSSKKTSWNSYGSTGSWVGGTTGYMAGNTWVSGTPGYYMPGTSSIFSDDTTIIKVRGTMIIFMEVQN